MISRFPLEFLRKQVSPTRSNPPVRNFTNSPNSNSIAFSSTYLIARLRYVERPPANEVSRVYTKSFLFFFRRVQPTKRPKNRETNPKQTNFFQLATQRQLSENLDLLLREERAFVVGVGLGLWVSILRLVVGLVYNKGGIFCVYMRLRCPEMAARRNVALSV